MELLRPMPGPCLMAPTKWWRASLGKGYLHTDQTVRSFQIRKDGEAIEFRGGDAASNDFIGHGEFIDYPIIFHQDGLVRGRQQHGLVGGAFMENIFTVGQ